MLCNTTASGPDLRMGALLERSVPGPLANFALFLGIAQTRTEPNRASAGFSIGSACRPAPAIVMLRVYVVNATSEAFGQAVTPLRELLGDAMPSITTIGVQALYKPEFKVEIEMVVRLP